MNKDENRLTLLTMDVEKESAQSAKQARETYESLRDFLSEQPEPVRKKKSIVIIGGGIVGLMSAFFLQKNGYDVTILEKKSFGAAASGRNGGGVLALGRELSEIPLARLAMEIWESLANEGIETKYVRAGHVMFARNSLEKEKLMAAHDLYNDAGLKVKKLSSSELRSLLPDLNPSFPIGLFSESDGQSYPFTTMSGLVEKLKENGATVVSGCEVLGFKTGNHEIDCARTNQGNFFADRFLFCAGPWTTALCQNLNEEVVVKPRRSQILVTEILNQRRIHPFVTGNSLYLRQTHAGNILFGGGGPWEINGYEVSNTSFAIEFLSQRLLESFPSYTNKQLIRAFAGTVELTDDHLPYFGKINAWHNAFISAGYNGHGYGMSAVMGKIIANSLSNFDSGKSNSIVASILADFSTARLKSKAGEQIV